MFIRGCFYKYVRICVVYYTFMLLWIVKIVLAKVMCLQSSTTWALPQPMQRRVILGFLTEKIRYVFFPTLRSYFCSGPYLGPDSAITMVPQ